MLSLLCKRRLFVAAFTGQLSGNPSVFIALPNASSFCYRSLSSLVGGSSLPGDVSLTKSYLIDSCGLNPESANDASKKVTLKFPKNSDLVLALLRGHGFTDAQIAEFVPKWPGIVNVNPDKTLLPKLEFFASIGLSSLHLPRMLLMCPGMLGHSLKRRLIPFHDYLKKLLRSDEEILAVYMRSANYLTGAFNRMPTNVSILRKRGVSESNIKFLLMHRPSSLTMRPEKLMKLIEKVDGLGISASKLMFVEAIDVLHYTSEVSWERKKRIYGRWGWSESDILKAFTIHSGCMSLSEEKIMSTMEFLVKEMNYDPRAIASMPTVLFYSLDKRIVPRCRVVQVLMAMGHMKRPYSIVTLVSMTNQRFKDRFVSKHKAEVPQIVDVYSGKLSPIDLGLSSGELARVKLL